MVTGMVAAKLDEVTASLNVTSTFTTSAGPQRLLAQPVLLKAMLLMVGAAVSAVITGVVTAAWVRVAALPAASVRDPVKVLAAMVMAPLSVPWIV
jgi:hypothetical protein